MDFFRRKKRDIVPTIPLPSPPPYTPGCSPTVTVVDFAAHNLPEHKDKTALVIDNAFSPEEIANLLKHAVDSNDGKWEVAQVNVGGGRQVTATDYRNSGRIIVDDFKLVDDILKKFRQYLPTAVEQVPGAKWHKRVSSEIWWNSFYELNPELKPTEQEIKTGKLKKQGVPQGAKEPVAKLTRLNERLRFLRYGEGQFFQPHSDGCYWTPGGKEVSYFTLQIYLNAPGDDVEGGATRIFGKDSFVRGQTTAEEGAVYVDIEPLPGRVLIFEQENLPHSGEEVTKGVKYSVRTDFMYEVA